MASTYHLRVSQSNYYLSGLYMPPTTLGYYRHGAPLAGRAARLQAGYRIGRAMVNYGRRRGHFRYATAGQGLRSAWDWWNKAPASQKHLGPSMPYRKPPRVRLAKQRSKMKKGDLKKLQRYQIKFPIQASVRVILGNQAASTGSSIPLGPQWTRSTTVAKDTGAAANLRLCGFVVPLTKLHNVKVGQGTFTADSSAPSAGRYTQQNLLFDIASDGGQMGGLAHNYQCTGLRAQTDADYLVSGVKGSFSIGGMQQSTDQKVYVQVVRRFDRPLAVDSVTAEDMKELVNTQAAPNNQHWVQLYRKSFILKGRAAGSAKISTRHVSFDLPLNFKRSKTKKVSTAASATKYGTQLDYAFENSEEMYNTLFLVITSRALNITGQEACDDLIATKATPGVDDGGGRMDPKIGIKGYVQTMYRYRNSQVEPGEG
jgi:hypothetical protein